MLSITQKREFLFVDEFLEHQKLPLIDVRNSDEILMEPYREQIFYRHTDAQLFEG